MKYLLIIIAAIFFISCKKIKYTNTISGKFIKCQNNIESPVANQDIDLFQQNNGSDNKSKILANTTTDAQGNFRFTYTTTNNEDKLIIRTATRFGYNRYIENIPVAKDVSDIVVYANPRYSIVVSLNVTKPHTNMDTLYINNIKYLNYQKKAGPFVTGRVYVESLVELQKGTFYNENKETIYCGLNSLSNLIYNKDYIIENSKLCGDTVYVTLDIK